jgi:hypothetical protein
MTDERCNADLGPLTAKLLEQQREIARLTAERDEARREVCRLVSSEIRPYYSRTPEEWARHCGWNCFTEDGK